MQHYCFVVGWISESGKNNGIFIVEMLCSGGKDSPLGLKTIMFSSLCQEMKDEQGTCLSLSSKYGL